MTEPATAPSGQPAQQPAPFEPYLPALAAAYAASMARIRANMLAFILRQFHHSGRWTPHDADQFTSVVPPIVAAAQQTVASITAAYLDRLATEMVGPRTRAPVVRLSEVSGSAVRHGVDPRAVYRRPYVQVWMERDAGTPLEQAVTAGERRAQTLVNTDLQLAKTHTAKQVFAQDERVVGYRRVPQGPHTCALCLILSTRRYRKEELAPIHPNCDCDVEPVFGDFDPGPVLDDEFLNAVHNAIKRDLGEKYVARSGKKGSTKARELDYRDIIIVHQHGEIGPVVGVRGQHFQGPDDIPRLGKHKSIADQL